MPPKRKKSVRQKQKQRQSQSQKVIVNIGKTTTTKRRRNAGRGRLPPPSYQQNLFPPTIIQQQAPNIAVLENQISRLTSMIQEPTGIKQPTTPLGLDTQAKSKTAEAQKMAGEQAEARRPGPTAENFQVPASVADERFDRLMQETSELIKQQPPSRARAMSQDLEGFEVAPPRSEQGSSLMSFEGSDVSIPFSMRKRPPSVLSSIPSIFFESETSSNQFQSPSSSVVRAPDPAFTQQLVNDKKPPNMGNFGQGEGGGNIPFAESVLKRGRPFDSSKITRATPERGAQEPTIQSATAPTRYTPAQLKSMPEKERNVIFKQVGIKGKDKIKQYRDLYKFGEP